MVYSNQNWFVCQFPNHKILGRSFHLSRILLDKSHHGGKNQAFCNQSHQILHMNTFNISAKIDRKSKKLTSSTHHFTIIAINWARVGTIAIFHGNTRIGSHLLSGFWVPLPAASHFIRFTMYRTKH